MTLSGISGLAHDRRLRGARDEGEDRAPASTMLFGEL